MSQSTNVKVVDTKLSENIHTGMRRMEEMEQTEPEGEIQRKLLER